MDIDMQEKKMSFLLKLAWQEGGWMLETPQFFVLWAWAPLTLMLDDTSGTPLKVGRKGPLEMNLPKESPSWLGLIGAMRCDACVLRRNNMDPTGTWIVRGFTQATVKTSNLSREETECESKVRYASRYAMHCTVPDYDRLKCQQCSICSWNKYGSLCQHDPIVGSIPFLHDLKSG
jgi:hypothetical protein